MEKIKEFFKKYKWLAVGLLAVVFVVVYKLFFSKSQESAGGSVQAFSPAPSTGGGSGSVDTTGAALEAIKDVITDSQEAQQEAAKTQQESQTSFLSGLIDTMGGFMGGIKDTLTAQNSATSEALKAITDSNKSFQQSVKSMINDSISMLKTSVVMPDVPTPKYSYEPSYTARAREDPDDDSIGKKVVELNDYIRSTGKSVPTSSISKPVQSAQDKAARERQEAEFKQEGSSASFAFFHGTPGL